VRLALPAVGTGIAYYLAAATSLFLTRGEDGIAMLWPASSILFATLLVAPQQRAGWFLGTAIMLGCGMASHTRLGSGPIDVRGAI